MDVSVILVNSLTALLNAEALYLALAALGLNIHFGYTGLLNFGQVGFLTVAAYGLGVGVTYLDLPFFAAILLGLGLAVLLALLLGIPTLRLRADYLAIVTIASSEVLRLVARSATLRDVTGGSAGITGFARGFYSLNPLPDGRYGIGPVDYNESRAWLLIVGWSLVVLASLLVFLLMRSPWGLVLKAIREDEDAVRSLGKNVIGYKMQSLVLGGVFGALGGFVFALANSSIQPDNYSTLLTFFAFTAMILGGAGRILGPVIGAILFSSFFTFLENTLVQAVNADLIPTSLMNTNQVGIVRFILVGALLMALMIFRPQGIFGDKKELALDAR